MRPRRSHGCASRDIGVSASILEEISTRSLFEIAPLAQNRESPQDSTQSGS